MKKIILFLCFLLPFLSLSSMIKKSEIRCAICKKIIEEDSENYRIEFEPCGHKYHFKCLKNIKECVICLKEFKDKAAKDYITIKFFPCGHIIKIPKKKSLNIKKEPLNIEKELPSSECSTCLLKERFLKKF
ncbi:hypothetical protein GF385_02555 [Candidatus Dependentiae bacterium]|nr:hypothetical protein [Candidatus Dependentiae bacterium]